MTTIAILGGGIAARSLLYTMAKKNFREKILVFYSDSFAFPCSLHSTAIVAPRGVSSGHSVLGDTLLEGFRSFSSHVKEDAPAGVIRIPQYTGALTKIDAFRTRYPDGKETSVCGPLRLKEEVYVAEEEAFLIRPSVYLDWLMKEAAKKLDITIVSSFVTEIKDSKITTQEQKEYSFDRLVIAGGVQNPLWSSLFPDHKQSKSAQGSYLEFQASLTENSFSLTLEGDNLIYDHEIRKLLIGSTTRESSLELPPEKELHDIYTRLKSRVDIQLPEYSSGKIMVGLREKASRRESYILNHGRVSMMGGLYKNGYSLSLHLSGKLLKNYLSSPLV